MRIVFSSIFYTCFIVFGFAYQAQVLALTSVELAHAVQSSAVAAVSSGLVELKLIRSGASRVISHESRINSLLIMAPETDSEIDTCCSIQQLIDEQASYANCILVLKKSCICPESPLAEVVASNLNVTILVINDVPSLLPRWLLERGWVINEVENTESCPGVEIDEDLSPKVKPEDRAGSDPSGRATTKDDLKYDSSDDEEVVVDDDDSDYKESDDDDSDYQEGYVTGSSRKSLKRGRVRGVEYGKKKHVELDTSAAKASVESRAASKDVRKKAFYNAISALLRKKLSKNFGLFISDELGVKFSTELSGRVTTLGKSSRGNQLLITSLNNYKRVLLWRESLNDQNWTIVFIADDEDAINTMLPARRLEVLRELCRFNRFVVASKNLGDNGYRGFFKDPKTGQLIERFLYPRVGKSSQKSDSAEETQWGIASVIVAALQQIGSAQVVVASLAEKPAVKLGVSGAPGRGLAAVDDVCTSLLPLAQDLRRHTGFVDGGGGGGGGCGCGVGLPWILPSSQENALGAVSSEIFVNKLSVFLPAEIYKIVRVHRALSSGIGLAENRACVLASTSSVGDNDQLERKTIEITLKNATNHPAVSFFITLTINCFLREKAAENKKLTDLLERKNVHFVFSDAVTAENSAEVSGVLRSIIYTQDPVSDAITVYVRLNGKLKSYSLGADVAGMGEVIARCIQQIAHPSERASI